MARMAYITSTISLTLLTISLHTIPTFGQALSYAGCYSSSNGLTESSTFQYQSSGHCQTECVGKGQAVLGLSGGDDCWCGGGLPPTSAKVSDSNCNAPCTGYGQDACGGSDYWSVYFTGTQQNLAAVGGSGSSSSASNAGKGTAASTTATQTTPSVVTSIGPGKTVVVTQAAAATDTNDSSNNSGNNNGGGKSNTVGIAVGVVVGIIALALAALAFWYFYIRKRRRQDAEMNKPTGGAAMAETPKEWKIPSTARFTQYNRPNGADTRLDEQIAGNRASTYSLEDATDYSRKILTVANPDRQ